MHDGLFGHCLRWAEAIRLALKVFTVSAESAAFTLPHLI
jgi:hypothetical protein